MALSIAGVNLVVNNVTGAIGAIVSVRRQLALLAGTSASVGRTNRQTAGSAGALASAFTAPSRAITLFGNSVKNLGLSLNRLGAGISSVGFRLTFLVSIPVVSAFAAATRAATEFETSLTKIATLTDLGGQSLTQLSRDLLQLAPIVGIPANELAEGLFVIASAGERDAARAMDILTISAKASAVGLGETEVVARAVTAIMTVYGDEVKTAAHATDLLVATVREGNVEADRLAPSLGRVLSVMDSLGLSVNEGLAFIATFTRSGISAEEAITSLRSTLTTILRPTQSAREALSSVGISIDEIKASIADPSVGLSDTLIGLRGALESAGLEMSDLFGNVRSLAGVLFVTGDAADSFRLTQEAIANSAGDTQKAFDVVSQTTAFQLKQLQANFSVLGVTIGTILLPALNEIVNRLKPVLAAITEFALANPKLVLVATGFALVAAAIGPLLIVLGSLISAVGTIITGIGGFIALIGAALSPVGLLVGAILSLATALGIVLAASLDDIGRKTNITFSNIAQAAFAWGRNITISLARGIIQGIAAVVRALIQVGNVIRSWLQAQSPPRLLPDLEKWGAAALTSYMQGWLQGDFSIFNDLAGIIENFLRSTATGEDTSIVGAILGSRELVTQAVNEIRELGQITTQTLTDIGSLFGDASAFAIEYADALADVQAATAAIAQINADFESIANPINDELEAIGDRREEIEQQARIEELQSILDDENAPALAHELALMELREIELRNQLELAEENRDIALEAAQAEEQAAQQRLEIAQQLLEITIQQNELFKELTQTLEELGGAGGGALEDLGGDLGGAGGGLEDFLPGDLPPLDEGLDDLTEGLGQEFLGMFEDLLGGDLKESKTGITGFFNSLVAEIQPDIDNLMGLVETLGDVWSDVFIELPRNIEIAKAKIFLEFNTLKTNVILAINELKAEFNKFKTAFFANEDVQALIAILATFKQSIMDSIQPVIPIVKEFAAEMVKFISGIDWNRVAEIAGILVGAFISIQVAIIALGAGIVVGIVNAISSAIQTFASIKEKFGTFFEEIKATAVLGWNQIIQGFKDLFEFKILSGFTNLLKGVANIVAAGFTGIITTFITGFALGLSLVKGFVEGVFNFFKDLFNALVGESIIPELINKILEFFGNLPGDILSRVQSGLGSLLAGMRAIGESIIGAIIDGINSGMGALNDLLSGLGSVGGGSTPPGKDNKLPGAQEGGVFSGPQSGFPVILHGREAVVPLGRQRLSSAPLMSGGMMLQSAGMNSEVNIGPNTVNNGMDMATFEVRVKRIVKNTLRGN